MNNNIFFYIKGGEILEIRQIKTIFNDLINSHQRLEKWGDTDTQEEFLGLNKTKIVDLKIQHY